MTCEADNIGPTCKVPMFPIAGAVFICPDCGQNWTADTYWRTK